MKTYLITGGAGFIGSNFVKYMLRKQNRLVRIIVLDSLTYAGNLKTLEKELSKIIFIRGDIRDKQLVWKIFEEYDIDYVVNFAAESHVDRSIDNPQLFLETNILGTQNIIDCAMKAWKVDETNYKENVRFLQISTDEVYGSLGDTGFFNEKTQLAPHSPYAASKTSADLVVKAYIDTFNFPALITRCSNNYGPFQFPEKLIPLVIKNIVEGKNIPIYGDGKNVRDWLHVDDHCEAIELVLNEGKLGEVYNVGGNNEKTNIEIVECIIEIINSLINTETDYKKVVKIDKSKINNRLIKFVKDRKGHDYRYAIDASKLRTQLNWTPKISFDNGIKSTVIWYLENQNWVNDVASGAYKSYYERMYGHSESIDNY